MLRRVIVSLALMLSLSVGESAEPDSNGLWKAGVASIDITPGTSMWMAGYAARKKPAEGKLHDLKAKALAFEDPLGNRSLLITMDLVGIPRDVSEAVCDSLMKQHDLPREAILLSVSHTHSGPIVGNNLRPAHPMDDTNRKLITAYTQVLEEDLVKLGTTALAALAPARLSWGNGYVTFGVNRRNNPEKDAPQLREEGRLVGPIDHDVPVLAVRSSDGTLQAVLFGYACHATTLDGYDWSGDYPGFAQIALEKAHPGATSLFFAGCGADQNPLPRRSIALAEAYGNQLAAGVEAVLDAPMQPIEGELRTAYREIPLKFATVPTREQLIETMTSGNVYEQARAEMLLAKLDREKTIPSEYPYPVQTWGIGGLALVALGGEVVVDYSLRIKRELSPKPVWVAGYTNDVMAYIPSRRVLEEGGYEGGGAMVYYGLPSAWTPDVEEAILSAVHDQAREIEQVKQQ